MTSEHGKEAQPYPHANRGRSGIVYPNAIPDISVGVQASTAVPWRLASRFSLALASLDVTDSPNDRDVLARLRGGDHDAFETIFRQWYEPVVRSASRVLRDVGVAEELSQDVFLELWRRRESLAPDSSVAGYLMQAVRNRALNHLRHLAVQRKSVVYVEAMSEPSERADAQAQASELQMALSRAIAALPPRTREVFVMSRERGLRYSEIAQELGVSVKAVEANMSRALRILREELRAFLPDQDAV